MCRFFRSFLNNEEFTISQFNIASFGSSDRFSREKSSRRFENDVAVWRGVARPNQADGVRDTPLEIEVRLARGSYTAQCQVILLAHSFTVGAVELVRHPGRTDLKIAAQRFDHLQHGRNVVAQRKVDGFDLRPERKAAVGDDECVGVTHARHQR